MTHVRSHRFGVNHYYNSEKALSLVDASFLNESILLNSPTSLEAERETFCVAEKKEKVVREEYPLMVRVLLGTRSALWIGKKVEEERGRSRISFSSLSSSSWHQVLREVERAKVFGVLREALYLLCGRVRYPPSPPSSACSSSTPSMLRSGAEEKKKMEIEETQSILWTVLQRAGLSFAAPTPAFSTRPERTAVNTKERIREGGRNSAKERPGEGLPLLSTTPLLTIQELEELPARWAISSLSQNHHRTTPVTPPALPAFLPTVGAPSSRASVEHTVPTTIHEQKSHEDLNTNSHSSSNGTRREYPVDDKRYHVTALDVGATVRWRRSVAVTTSAASSSEVGQDHVGHVLQESMRYRITAISPLRKGEYWVEVVPAIASHTGEDDHPLSFSSSHGTPAEEEESGAHEETKGFGEWEPIALPSPSHAVRVHVDTLCLDPPVSLHLDPLLPCEELFHTDASSPCLFLAFLREYSTLASTPFTHTPLPSAVPSVKDGDARQDSEASGGLPSERHPTSLPSARHPFLQVNMTSRPLISFLSVQEAISLASEKSFAMVKVAKVCREVLHQRIRQINESEARDLFPIQPCETKDQKEISTLDSSVEEKKRQCSPFVLCVDGKEDTLVLFLGHRDAMMSSGYLPPLPTPAAPRASMDVSHPSVGPTVQVLWRTAQKLARRWDVHHCTSLPSHTTYPLLLLHHQDATEEREDPLPFPSAQEALKSWKVHCHLHCTADEEDTRNRKVDARHHEEWDASSIPPREEVRREGSSLLSTSSGLGSPLFCGSETTPRTVKDIIEAKAMSSFSTCDGRSLSCTTTIDTLPRHRPRFTTSHPFFADLFTMLLRYQSLFGDKGYNQGPQAAVPPVVMHLLQQEFHTSAEAFASSLNVSSIGPHCRFGSLFPDVDSPFGGGSIGSFFDVELLSGHWEVNPPFDAHVLRQLQRQLLRALERAAHSGDSLLFVLILPSHDLDPEEEKKKEDVASTKSGTTSSGVGSTSTLSTNKLDMDGSSASSNLSDSRKRWREEPSPRSPRSAGIPFTDPRDRKARHEMSTRDHRSTETISHLQPPPPPAREQSFLRTNHRRGPSRNKNKGNTSTSVERVLRESAFCLGHVLCAEREAAYMDGHQHLLRVPLFRLETPTRLIVLGNDAARHLFPDAMTKLEKIRQGWKEWTFATASE